MGDTIDTLLVLAADSEVQAVLRSFDRGSTPETIPGEPIILRNGCWLLQIGVGKANAAARLARALALNDIRRVVNLGLGGSLPDSGLLLGQAILASRSVFADEGVDTPDGFLDCRSIGFALYQGDEGTGLPPDKGLAADIKGHGLSERIIATVSTCSGRDELATRIRRRTGAAAECMEGAAVMLACLHGGIPAAEIRVISNTTGDRTGQVWDIGLALEKLGAVAVSLSDISFR